MTPRVAVVGGGVSGLVAAYRLAIAGAEVVVYEQEAKVGGLASSVVLDGHEVDRYFHFACMPDTAYIGLIAQLGLSDKLVWRRTGMGCFIDGQYHRFGSPGSLMRFKPLPFKDRLRFASAVLSARKRADWSDLDRIAAHEWLVSTQGRRAYEAIWSPLLCMKFGVEAECVSAAWMWARMNRVGRSRRRFGMQEYLGYLDGGSATLTGALLRKLESLGAEVSVSQPVDDIVCKKGRVAGVRMGGNEVGFDAVVSTVATPVFVNLVKELPETDSVRLSQIEYFSVTCWALLARRPLCDDFWLNVNDARIPFPGVITYSNLDRSLATDGLYLHYVPMYMAAEKEGPSDAQGDPSAVLRALDIIGPNFSESIVSATLFKNRYAQPLYRVGFESDLGESMVPETGVSGLFRTDMSQTYPADRSIVNAVILAGNAAESAARFMGLQGSSSE